MIHDLRSHPFRSGKLRSGSIWATRAPRWYAGLCRTTCNWMMPWSSYMCIPWASSMAWTVTLWIWARWWLGVVTEAGGRLRQLHNDEGKRPETATGGGNCTSYFLEYIKIINESFFYLWNQGISRSNLNWHISQNCVCFCICEQLLQISVK